MLAIIDSAHRNDLQFQMHQVAGRRLSNGRVRGWCRIRVIEFVRRVRRQSVLVCEQCQSDDIDLIARLDDGRVKVACLACGNEWLRGSAKTAPRPVDTFAEARRRFPGPENVDPERLARVERLKQSFLTRRPEPDPEVTAYWHRYQRVFSRDGLQSCDPQDLKDFANTETGARPGNMSVFNAAWNNMGVEAAAQRTRDTIGFLLYGPDHIPMEDRLTILITENRDRGMTGFKESLLTKVLCIMQPDRFLPILTYSSPAGGKREIAKLVYDLELPEAARVQWTIGRLILWSNDVLLRLAGDGFVTMQHMSQFLWDAKDRQAEMMA